MHGISWFNLCFAAILLCRQFGVISHAENCNARLAQPAVYWPHWKSTEKLEVYTQFAIVHSDNSIIISHMNFTLKSDSHWIPLKNVTDNLSCHFLGPFVSFNSQMAMNQFGFREWESVRLNAGKWKTEKHTQKSQNTFIIIISFGCRWPKILHIFSGCAMTEQRTKFHNVDYFNFSRVIC